MFSSPLSGLTAFQRRRRVAAAPALVQPVDWWDSTQGVTVDGANAVSSWIDKISGYNAAQTTNANKPTLVANSVSFDGNSDFLLLSTGLSLVRNVPGLTVIAVASGTLVGRLFSASTSGAANQSRYTFGGTAGSTLLAVRRPDGTSGTNLTGSWSPSSSVFQAVAGIANYTTRAGEVRLNKTSVASSATLVPAGSDNTTDADSLAIVLGATGNGASFLSATVKDLLVFQQALTTAQTDSWVDYLAALRGF